MLCVYVLSSFFQVVEKLSDDMMITYMVTEPVAGGMISRRYDVTSAILVIGANRAASIPRLAFYTTI